MKGPAARPAKHCSGHYYTCRAPTTYPNGSILARVPVVAPLISPARVTPHDWSDGCTTARRDSVGYLAGLIAVAFVVFGWAYWPIGWILIAGLLIADFVLET